MAMESLRSAFGAIKAGYKVAGLILLIGIVLLAIGQTTQVIKEKRWTSDVAFEEYSRKRYGIQCKDLKFEEKHTMLYLRVIDNQAGRTFLYTPFEAFRLSEFEPLLTNLYLGSEGSESLRLEGYEVPFEDPDWSSGASMLNNFVGEGIATLKFSPLPKDSNKKYDTFRLSIYEPQMPKLIIQQREVPVVVGKSISTPAYGIIFIGVLTVFITFLYHNPYPRAVLVAGTIWILKGLGQAVWDLAHYDPNDPKAKKPYPEFLTRPTVIDSHPPKTEDEEKMDRVRQRRKLDLQWETETKFTSKVEALAALQKCRKEKRKEIINNKFLTDAERDEQLDMLDASYEQERRKIEADISIYEDA